MTPAEFLKLWSHEAANTPGIPVETVALTKSPILVRPLMQKSA